MFITGFMAAMGNVDDPHPIGEMALTTPRSGCAHDLVVHVLGS